MQYSTFAAIDIGSYDVILEIFEISKKQGIRSVDKICHRIRYVHAGENPPGNGRGALPRARRFRADHGGLPRGCLPRHGFERNQ